MVCLRSIEGSLTMLGPWRSDIKGRRADLFTRRNSNLPLREPRSKVHGWYQGDLSSAFSAVRGCPGFSGSGWQGSGINRLTPRSRIFVAVFTVAARTIPSAPGWTLMTRPKGQCINGTLSSRRITMVPPRMPCLPLSHLYGCLIRWGTLGTIDSKNPA